MCVCVYVIKEKVGNYEHVCQNCITVNLIHILKKQGRAFLLMFIKSEDSGRKRRLNPLLL